MWWWRAATVLARGAVAGVSAGTVTGLVVGTVACFPFGAPVGIWVGAAVGMALSAVAAPVLALAHTLMVDEVEAMVGASLASLGAAAVAVVVLDVSPMILFGAAPVLLIIGLAIGPWVVLGPDRSIGQDQDS